MTSANSDIHCQLTSSLVAVTREYIFGTWIFARLLTQAGLRVLKSAWIVALEFGCSWDWRRDHCIMHTGRCGQAPFLFIWSCRRKVVETRKSRIRAYPWIVVWSCSCSTPQYSANRSIRKQHQKTSLDRGTLSRFLLLVLFEHLHVLCLKNMQRQQQKAPQRSESKGPKTCFWGSKRS